MTQPRIVINVHGGLVQDVFVSDPDTLITIVDWDTDTCDLADDGLAEVHTHSGQRQRAYVADYGTNDWPELDGTDMALALAAAEHTINLNCEGCSDNSGARKPADGSCRISPPAGYIKHSRVYYLAPLTNAPSKSSISASARGSLNE